MVGRSPGFYPDPLSPAHERWWDGERWGEHARKADVSPAPAAGPTPAPVRAPAPGWDPTFAPAELKSPLPSQPGVPTPMIGVAPPAYTASPAPGLGLPPGPGVRETNILQAQTGPRPQSWRPAGFWRRLGGYVVDLVVVTGLVQLLLFAINSVLAEPLAVTNHFSYAYLESADWYIPALDGLTPLLWLLYRGLLEPTRARTLGQQLFGMRTLSADTLNQVGFRRSLHRHLLTAALLLATVYSPAAALAALVVIVIEHLLMLPRRGARQTGHDRLAGTVVEVVR
jgi:hypothetical protein